MKFRTILELPKPHRLLRISKFLDSQTHGFWPCFEIWWVLDHLVKTMWGIRSIGHKEIAS